MRRHTSPEASDSDRSVEPGLYEALERWQQTNPQSGEAFAYTGEAATPLGLRWSPNAKECIALRLGYVADFARVKELFEHGDPEAYAARMTDLANAQLAELGINSDFTMMK